MDSHSDFVNKAMILWTASRTSSSGDALKEDDSKRWTKRFIGNDDSCCIAIASNSGEHSGEFFSILVKSFFKSFIRSNRHRTSSAQEWGHRQDRPHIKDGRFRRALQALERGISHQAKHQTKDGSRRTHSAGCVETSCGHSFVVVVRAKHPKGYSTNALEQFGRRTQRHH